MPLRSVMMKRFILGFHRRVWCPKWTPLSRSWRMVTTAICFFLSVSASAPAGQAHARRRVFSSVQAARWYVGPALTLVRGPTLLLGARGTESPRPRGSAPARKEGAARRRACEVNPYGLLHSV